MARDTDRRAFAIAVGTTLYRALLRLYPYAFWQTYAEELEADFTEQSHEAAEASGAVGLARWWSRAALDLLVSLPAEWLRTPWIPVLGAAGVISAVIFTDVWVRGKRAFSYLGTDRSGESPQLLLLMALMVLIPVACTLAIWGAVRLANLTGGRRRRRV